MITGLFSDAPDVSGVDKSMYAITNIESNPSSLKGVNKLAQRVRIELTDDIDGSEAKSTVRFSLDNTSYEIDLSEAHEEELRGALEKFIQSARKVSGSARGASKRSGSATSSRDETQAIRLWAADNGINVNTRGRISSDVVEKYKAAHAA